MSNGRRPPIVPRSERPFSTLDAVLLTMIEAHAGKPCPTRREVREWTGMPRRRVWSYLEGMRDRGLIDLEVIESKVEGKDPKRRRMRKAGGDWTEWTARMGPDGKSTPRRPTYSSEGVVMNIDEKALKNFVDEIEASRARQRGETEHQREVFKKVRAAQLDAKAVRIVLNRRAMDTTKRDEQDYYVHAYEMALGGKKAAMEALAAGATQQEAAAAGGLNQSTVSRLMQKADSA